MISCIQTSVLIFGGFDICDKQTNRIGMASSDSNPSEIKACVNQAFESDGNGQSNIAIDKKDTQPPIDQNHEILENESNQTRTYGENNKSVSVKQRIQRVKGTIFPPGFFKQRHRVKQDGCEREIEIEIVVEELRFYAYLSFLLIVLIGMVLTYNYTASYTGCESYEKILTDVFGSLSLCVYFDFPPSTYVLPFLYSFLVVLVYAYVFASIFRAWISKEEKKITRLSFKLYCGAFVYFAVSISFFSTIFAVTPDLEYPNTIYIHTVPFINVIVAFTVLQIAVTWFGFKVAWTKKELRAPKWLRYVSLFCLFGIGISCVGKVIFQINALTDLGKCPIDNWEEIACNSTTQTETYVCGKGSFADVHSASYISTARLLDHSWNLFGSIFPIFQSGYFWFTRFKTHTLIFSVRDNRPSCVTLTA